MGTFLDSTDVALIAFLLGMGAILVIIACDGCGGETR